MGSIDMNGHKSKAAEDGRDQSLNTTHVTQNQQREE